MMNTLTRLSAYGVTAVLFGAAAYAAGSAVDVATAPLGPPRSGATTHTAEHSPGDVGTTPELTAPTAGSTLAPDLGGHR